MINYIKLIGVIAFGMCILLWTSCVSSNGEPFVHQRIPIEVKGDKVVTLQMHGLVGSHMVGIICSTEVWNELTNYQTRITVRLKSSDKQPAKVFGFELGGRYTTLCDQLANCHYFFAVSAIGNAIVEISFPKMPIDAPAEIIVCKTPEETESPY